MASDELRNSLLAMNAMKKEAVAVLKMLPGSAHAEAWLDDRRRVFFEDSTIKYQEGRALPKAVDSNMTINEQIFVLGFVPELIMRARQKEGRVIEEIQGICKALSDAIADASPSATP